MSAEVEIVGGIHVVTQELNKETRRYEQVEPYAVLNVRVGKSLTLRPVRLDRKRLAELMSDMAEANVRLLEVKR